jgi:hypothetical protein
LLGDSALLASTYWTGRLRAKSDLPCSSSEAQNNVLSFGDFSLHGQRKVTRSPKASESSASKGQNQQRAGCPTPLLKTQLALE